MRNMAKSLSVTESNNLQRNLLLGTALLAAVGGAAIYLFALPALWHMSSIYGLLFTALGTAQLITAIAVWARPLRQRILLAADLALIVVMLWVLARILRILPPPDPWIPVNSVIGFTDTICAALEAIGAAGLVTVVILRPHLSQTRQILMAPLFVFVLLSTILGVFASSDGFVGAGFPAGILPPRDLPAGKMSTVEYCRTNGVPLAMDLYMPRTRNAETPAPVALYVHGGGIWGDRKVYGLGAQQSNHAGALFTPLQQQLNEQGFVVASIDYRLPPATPWPASLGDAKCAVRFLRAHASGLGLDPNRIGVWGSSGGGQLSSLLGLTRPEDGFDRGQYLDQSSSVQAVVDMFGLVDLNDFEDADPFGKFVLRSAFGPSTDVRRSASPIIYLTPGAPPFLILHGTDDTLIPLRQSEKLAQSLEAMGVPVTLIKVEGAEHDLNTPGQHPAPEELTLTIVDFFVKNLK